MCCLESSDDQLADSVRTVQPGLRSFHVHACADLKWG